MKQRIIPWLLVFAILFSLPQPARATEEEIIPPDPFPNTHVNTGDQRYDILQVALTQLGYKEGENNDTKYGTYFNWPNTEWCGWFVSWCAVEAGVPKSVIKRQGKAYPEHFGLESFTAQELLPQPGDLYFKTSGHVGFVYKVEGDYFWTLEGNSSDQVESEKLKLYDSRYVFASPAYETDPPRPEIQFALDAEHFPDAAFRTYLGDVFDDNKDGKLSRSECSAVKKLNLAGKAISSLGGIGYFTRLEHLDCSGTGVTALDLSENPALTYLNCSNTPLASLQLTGAAGLQELYCSGAALCALDVTGCTALRRLDCRNNQLAALTLGSLPGLVYLRCGENQLAALDLTGCRALEVLECEENRLTALDVTPCVPLEELNCRSNLLTGLDLSGNPGLLFLDCTDNRLTSLDLTALPALEDWLCHGNTYTVSLDYDGTFDLTQLPAGFDLSKASGWEGGAVSGSLLTVAYGTASVSYDYSCGDRDITFTLIPQWKQILGDVDGNGKIETYDALAILYHLNGRSQLNAAQVLAADVTRGGSVDIWDVMQMLYYLNRRIDKF